jgi:chitinase
MHLTVTLFSIVSLLASIPSAIAGFSSSSQSNVAIYWG